MTSQGNGQTIEYDVRMSEHTRAELKLQQWEASQAGIGEQFLSALRLIEERLRTNPMSLREPRYRLPALQLLICQAVVSPLVVEYAIHEALPLVFIRNFKVLS